MLAELLLPAPAADGWPAGLKEKAFGGAAARNQQARASSGARHHHARTHVDTARHAVRLVVISAEMRKAVRRSESCRQSRVQAQQDAIGHRHSSRPSAVLQILRRVRISPFHKTDKRGIHCLDRNQQRHADRWRLAMVSVSVTCVPECPRAELIHHARLRGVAAAKVRRWERSAAMKPRASRCSMV